MRRLKSILVFLRSDMLTLWLVGAFIIYYLSMAVWSKEAFASFVNNLVSNNLFRGLYILFLVNVTFRSADALKALWGDTLRFVLRIPFYAGLLLFLFSFFISVNVRETVQSLVGQGDAVEIPWENTLYRVEGIESALKKHALKTKESLVFDYEPSILLADDNGTKHRITAFPPQRVRSAYVHILNFGVGPYVELRKGSAVVSQGYVPLRLTPFGNVDSFDITPYPYRFFLSILPNHVVKRGRETAREYDLEKPLYNVSITKGDKTVAKGVTDRTLSFEDIVSITFLPPADWVLLEIVYDPFLPGVAAGLVLLPLGVICFLLSFIFGQRKRSLLHHGR